MQEKKRDLFICFTPLQVLISKAIVQLEHSDEVRPDFVLVPPHDSDVFRHYFEDFSAVCEECFYENKLFRFPFYPFQLWMRFRKKRYRNVYLANVATVKAQYILSFCEFQNLYTFDDGTANIVKSSVFYKDATNCLGRAKRRLRKWTGNKYTTKKVIDRSKVHYTIYPNFENIVERKIAVNVFDFKKNTDRILATKDAATVVLGTVYRDIVQRGHETELLRSKIASGAWKIGNSDVYYLPHPRDGGPHFDHMIGLDVPLISEHVIMKLLRTYKTLDVAGFASSTQFNLISDPRVRNIVFKTSIVKLPASDLADLLEQSGATAFNLDSE